MRAWPPPHVPVLPGEAPPARFRDTATGQMAQPVSSPTALLYVCGITPYDSTHMGHAATYIAFDTLNRAWRDAGLRVHYVQNVTDVDDPLLERADATGVDWEELAAQEVQRFAGDMQALRVIPPDHYIGVVESIDLLAVAVQRMLEAAVAYRVPAADGLDDGAHDVYADGAADALIGSVGGLDGATMETLFAERGGDPEREGKKHPRDPLLWRAARAGEPAFDGGPLGRGRPGWHIECAAIAEQYLGVPFDVQGGGTDLIYPHHELSISHLRALAGEQHPARAFLHTGLVAYEGHKMSKSRGNLVFVSALLASGEPGAAVRLVALAHHYSENWEYTEDRLHAARERLRRWCEAVRVTAGPVPDGGGPDGEHSTVARGVLEQIRAALADDLTTPAAVHAVDAWAAGAPHSASDAALVADAVDALLGIDLRDPDLR